ncbi:NUDIX domain-containing protein [Chloroflexota bacterium]
MAGSLQEKQVVTCFLESKGKILLLRRSKLVGSYQGKWAGVSGYLENVPDAQALSEIVEETGLFGGDINLIKKGEPLTIDDEELNARWVVHPYLFHVNNPKKIKIDWEHKETKWIKPKDMDKYQTVPNLKETLDRVYTK